VALIMGIIYPACIMSCVSILSFAIYAVTQRLVVIPLALVSTGVTVPFVTTIALQIGRYIRDFSHLYRGKYDIRAWLDFKKQNPYIFTDKHSDQKDAPPIFNRQRTEEPRYVFFFSSNINLFLFI
jgi:hypothetical protein